GSVARSAFPTARAHWSIIRVSLLRHQGIWKSQARKRPSSLSAVESSHKNSARSIPLSSSMSAMRYHSSSVSATELTAMHASLERSSDDPQGPTPDAPLHGDSRTAPQSRQTTHRSLSRIQ